MFEDVPTKSISKLPKFKKSGAGFTLIEIVIVISLLAIIGAFAVIASLGDYRSYLFRGDRDLVINVLQKARSQAINNVCIGSGCLGGKPHGAHFTSGQYVVFQGPSYAGRDSAVDNIITINDPINTSGSDVVFTQLSATTVPATITVSDSAGHSSDITINSEGRIDW